MRFKYDGAAGPVARRNTNTNISGETSERPYAFHLAYQQCRKSSLNKRVTKFKDNYKYTSDEAKSRKRTEPDNGIFSMRFGF